MPTNVSISSSDGRIVVNGKTYVGRDVSVRNGVVHVDGKPAGGLPDAGPITIHVHGNCGSVELGAGTVTIEGAVSGHVNTGSGDIRCGNVGGDVKTGAGDIRCGDVAGDAETAAGDIMHGR